MKTLLIGLVCIVSMLTVLPNISFKSGQQKVKGNGSIVTRTIEIGDFSEIDLGSNIESGKNIFGGSSHPAVFNYVLTEDAPQLQITTDENLLPLIEIKVNGNSLTIKSKDGKTKLIPTQLTINGSSRNLTKVNISGCMDFVSERPIQLKELKASVSGVGDIKMNDLECGDLSCRVSGVGNIKLTGKADKGDFQVSGVGHIYCYDCVVKDMKCGVSGVGGAEVNVSDNLEANVSGVGSIKYKGTANVQSNKSGVGSIKCVNN
ncbi:head GIN domain-containing protein [Parabacteroides provencensis]|uniref:head GIN domain-containing protein n=1 Tax=Parabacteroides provencensis TaxID=1944636 RepID=UPI000C15706A|nr:head GIN domain-containing protein [Parabacteroides provencensis]